MNETVKKVGRWLCCLIAALVVACIAIWMGFNAWESSRETARTPLGQLTLGQIGATLFWVIGALVAVVVAALVWEDRYEGNRDW